jgi:predicted nucleic acid-binding protein
MENGAVRIALSIEDHVPELRRLLRKYRDQPMSLADACIVRMAELHEHHAILTFDSDFLVYRKHTRTPLPLIYPTP